MVKSQIRCALLERYGIVAIIAFVAGLPPSLGLAEETARAQIPRKVTRCEESRYWNHQSRAFVISPCAI